MTGLPDACHLLLAPCCTCSTGCFSAGTSPDAASTQQSLASLLPAERRGSESCSPQQALSRKASHQNDCVDVVQLSYAIVGLTPQVRLTLQSRQLPQGFPDRRLLAEQSLTVVTCSSSRTHLTQRFFARPWCWYKTQQRQS